MVASFSKMKTHFEIRNSVSKKYKRRLKQQVNDDLESNEIDMQMKSQKTNACEHCCRSIEN